MQRLLIIGCGDIARRALPWLVKHYRVYAAIRSPARIDELRALGVTPLGADLDRPRSLRRLAGLANVILHFAPPPAGGEIDTRMRDLLAALSCKKILPRRLVYISTSGVYGDCAGERVVEERPGRPQTARARRRADAEARLRRFGRRLGVNVSILRAPGIYAADRLPLERLQKGLPALVDRDDVYTNHIHADDLAAACVAAVRRAGNNRVYNVVDDSELKMADYFDRVADAFALPRPPRLTRAEAGQSLSPLQMSFMRESRRIGNRRLKEELKLRLAYPTVDAGIAAALARRNACSS